MTPRIYCFLLFLGMLLVPILLILLPKTFFDDGPVTCIFTLLTGTHCAGCGMTRACMRLIHFEFAEAWALNKLSFIVFGGLVLLYMRLFISQLHLLIKGK